MIPTEACNKACCVTDLARSRDEAVINSEV